MRTVSFTVFGLAQPKGSSRAFKRGPRIIVTSDNPSLRKWEELVRYEAQRVAEKDPRLFEGAVSLSVVFYLPRPASVSEKKRPHPITRPDLSKTIRGIEDPLSGVLYRDDAQVVTITAAKVYTDGPAKAVITLRDVVLQELLPCLT